MTWDPLPTANRHSLNSRFWCPGTEAVDDFSVSWASENNWLIPPIFLTPKFLVRSVSEASSRGPRNPVRKAEPITPEIIGFIMGKVVTYLISGLSVCVDSHNYYAGFLCSSELLSSRRSNIGTEDLYHMIDFYRG